MRISLSRLLINLNGRLGNFNVRYNVTMEMSKDAHTHTDPDPVPQVQASRRASADAEGEIFRHVLYLRRAEQDGDDDRPVASTCLLE